MRQARRVTRPLSSLRRPPEIVDWRTDTLPRRPLRWFGRGGSLPFGLVAPPHLPTGPARAPFDVCTRLRDLSAAIVDSCTELAHIDVGRLLFTVTQARNGRAYGLQARVTP